MQYKIATYFKSIYLEKKTITVEANSREEAFKLCSEMTDKQLNNDSYYNDIEILDCDIPVDNISCMWIENDGTVWPEYDPFDDYED